MEILLALATAIGIIWFILWCLWRLICKIDNWAKAKPDYYTDEEWKFEEWKRRNCDTPMHRMSDAQARYLYQHRND